ncbi:MAG TPA: tRNA (adenosine(37)-N6)-threonylcarbamoyltransferase complex ATPase subunit type 1 TsaE, partial [Acidimicrobiales bacterium]|nr:tRNA (adenosine(37)-N6)-threonylcarbamoyltransferase complex ATPase subunit type 1 TsaE [Acidimicrobiales bacterium]
MTPAAEPTVLRARTESAAGTKALAAELACELRPGDMVLLVGDLGAGKTTFAQGLAAALGVDEPVTSPTFTLVRPYRCASPLAHAIGVRTMQHADLYRLGHLQEVADLGIGELVEDDAVAVVEWGDVADSILGRDALVVRLVPEYDEADDAVAAGGDERRRIE